ncbi:hypothetical protein AMTRI_Chr02g264080 [Amborella trichopoda]
MGQKYRPWLNLQYKDFIENTSAGLSSQITTFFLFAKKENSYGMESKHRRIHFWSKGLPPFGGQSFIQQKTVGNLMSWVGEFLANCLQPNCLYIVYPIQH